MSATIQFETWKKPPLSMNDRLNRHVHADRVASIRSVGRVYGRSLVALGKIKTGEPIRVRLVWYTPDRTRRDTDNTVATLKPLCDGLVDAKIVPDDTPEWMDKLPTRIVYRKGEPGLELHIETVAERNTRAALAAAKAMGCKPSYSLYAAEPEGCQQHESGWRYGGTCTFATRIALAAIEAGEQ